MNKKIVSAFYTLALFCAFFYGIAPLCIAQTDGFSVARIHSDFPTPIACDAPPLTDELRVELMEIFAQPFSYLACGGQCFAFVSQDGRYVIKFFKHHFRKPYSYMYACPLPKFLDRIRTLKMEKKKQKTMRDFNSYTLAFNELKEESGLLYIRLKKDETLSQMVTITDKIGISHVIDLNEVEFVLQKKGTLAYDHLNHLVKENNAGAIQDCFASIMDVIIARCQKGIFDEDPKIHRNLGFVGSSPLFIDVGRFTRDESRKDPAVYHQDLALICKRFHHYLEDTYPHLAPLLDVELERYQCAN